MSPKTQAVAVGPEQTSWIPFRAGSRWNNRIDSWQLLALPAFRAYFLGSVASNLGTWLQTTAQILLAYQLTHSAYGVGLITAGQFSGFLVIGPWAGRIADRLGPRRVLISTQFASAVFAMALGLLQLTHHLTEAGLFAGATATGLAATLALPVQNALAPGLVPEPAVKGALALNSVSYNIGRTASPALYLVLLAGFGTGWAFVMNGISFVVFAVTIMKIYPSSLPAADRPAAGWAGLRIIVRRPRIMLLLAMVAAITIADDPVQVIGPSLARHMHVSPTVWASVFLGALGLGTIMGSPFLPRWTAARRAAPPLIFLAVSVVVFAISPTPWISLLAAVCAGAAALWTGSAAQAQLLKTAGARSRPEVMGYWMVAWAGTKPIASFVDGALATHWGLWQAAVCLTTPAVLVAVAELFLADRARTALKELMRRHNAAFVSL
jgi:MFS family permease